MVVGLYVYIVIENHIRLICGILFLALLRMSKMLATSLSLTLLFLFLKYSTPV